MSGPAPSLAAAAVFVTDAAGRWAFAPEVAIGLTLAVLAVCVATLAATNISPDVVLLGGLVVLAAARVVPVADALSGFGNAGLATVAVLFVVAEGLRQTGAVDFVGRRMLGTPGSRGSAVARVAVPSAVLSAFLNNTAVVATALPVVGDWARKHRISPSHLLMPLSFATVLGGMCTLVGTSTLLVLDGEWKRWAAGRDVPRPDGLGLFEIGWIGVPAAAIGLVVLILASGRLLPARKVLERELTALGLEREEISIRMTGCPNGCARPYTAELAFVGRSLDKYNVYVGGAFEGTRLVTEYAEMVSGSELVRAVTPLLNFWREARNEGERFGDFCHRVGIEGLREHAAGTENATTENATTKHKVVSA